MHLRWPSALADKTGFDRRHSVSSVLFEPFSLSLFSLQAGQRVSARATLSSSVHGWIYHRLLPPFDEFVLELATCLELRLRWSVVFDTASIPRNDFQSSTYSSRPGGAHLLCDSASTYSRPGGAHLLCDSASPDFCRTGGTFASSIQHATVESIPRLPKIVPL